MVDLLLFAGDMTVDPDMLESILMGFRLFMLFVSSMIIFALAIRIAMTRAHFPDCMFKTGLSFWLLHINKLTCYLIAGG